MFGKIIISEIFVPKKYKTIKPVTGLGGYAGGTLKKMEFYFISNTHYFNY
jgi:hypothetical protein